MLHGHAWTNSNFDVDIVYPNSGYQCVTISPGTGVKIIFKVLLRKVGQR